MVGDVVIHSPKIDMHPSMEIKRHPEVSTEIKGYLRTEGKGKKLQKVSWDFYDRCIGELTVLRNECERIAQDFGKPSFRMDEYIEFKSKADTLEHDLTDLWQKRSVKIAGIAVHPESEFEAGRLLPIEEQYFRALKANNAAVLNIIKGGAQ